MAQCMVKPSDVLTEALLVKIHEADGHRLGPYCWLDRGHRNAHAFRTNSETPWAEVVRQVEELAKDNHIQIYQKWTCQGCGNRLMIDEPNILYRTGSCDLCGTVTDIVTAGCGYLLKMEIRP